jgi:hypothetical protein
MRYVFLSHIFCLLALSSSAMANQQDRKDTTKSDNASEEDTHFQILEALGTVLLWEPYATKWREAVVGYQVSGETIIQVRANSSAQIQVLNQKGLAGIGKAELSFKVNRPTIGRLNDQYLRSINIEKMFIDKLPDVQELPEEMPGELLSELDEAWNRFAAVFSGDEVPVKALELSARARPEEDFEITVKQKKISILSPGNDSTLSSEKSPVEKYIYWQLEEQTPEEVVFDVFVWEKGRSPTDPIGTTKESRYKMQLQPGMYQIQVVSHDKKWGSEVHTVTVLENVGLSESADRLASERSDPEDISIFQLKSPPDDFNIFTNKDKGRIYFSWNNDQDLKSNRKFHFVISTDRGQRIFEKMTYDREVSVSLKPGNYRWHVQDADNIDANGRIVPTIRSESYIFSVNKKKTRRNWASKVEGLVNGRGGIIYLDQ